MHRSLRNRILALPISAAVLFVAAASGQSTGRVQDLQHYSKVFGEERNFRVFLPASYSMAATGDIQSFTSFTGIVIRPVEVFTSDPCADTTERVSDPWGSYDNVGATAKYTVLLISSLCQPSRHELLLRKPFRRSDNHSKLGARF
jgi:hypothetical protein